METKLFKWGQCDYISDASLFFYSVELVIAVGKHKIGTKFYGAMVDYENGILELYTDDKTLTTYRLELKVIE